MSVNRSWLPGVRTFLADDDRIPAGHPARKPEAILVLRGHYRRVDLNSWATLAALLLAVAHARACHVVANPGWSRAQHDDQAGTAVPQPVSPETSR